MSETPPPRQRILMLAYTNYRTDPRVIREAEAAAPAELLKHYDHAKDEAAVRRYLFD